MRPRPGSRIRARRGRRGAPGAPFFVALGCAALAVLAPGGVAAQSAATEVDVAARALQGQLGLMAGLGSEVPGSAGTLGRRLGTAPRFAVSVRAAFMNGGVPDLSDPGGAPSRGTDYTLPAVHAGVAAGLFDGFSVLPTLGGILSVDALAGTSLVLLPGGEGFDGSVGAVTLGVRLGLLRESFTVPGVSVSVTRRWIGEATYGDLDAGYLGAVTVDPAVTSIRATVGKDLLSVGVMGGIGWDRYGGSYTARLAGAAPGDPATLARDLSQNRTLYFGAASLNFLILQISGEVGWAQGFDPVPGYLGAPFDLTDGDLFGSLAFRLTI